MIDNQPPWVAEQVRQAQALVDRAWAAHVHDTEHAARPDWAMPVHLWGGPVRQSLCGGCPYCATVAMRPNAHTGAMHLCRYCIAAAEGLARHPSFEESLIDAATAALNDPTSALPLVLAPYREEPNR